MHRRRQQQQQQLQQHRRRQSSGCGVMARMGCSLWWLVRLTAVTAASSSTVGGPTAATVGSTSTLVLDQLPRGVWHTIRQRVRQQQLQQHQHHQHHSTSTTTTTTSSSTGHSSNSSAGTRITRIPPTRQAVAQWFGDHPVRAWQRGSRSRTATTSMSSSFLWRANNHNHEDDDRTNHHEPLVWRNVARTQRGSYNHATAGHTNPTLHILPNISDDSRHHDNHRDSSSNNNNDYDDDDDDDSALWWPGTTSASSSLSSHQRQPSHQQQHLWRVVRLRRTVGYGTACYQACRDAALAWEFQSGTQGIVQVVPDNNNNNNNRHQNSNDIDNGNADNSNMDRRMGSPYPTHNTVLRWRHSYDERPARAIPRRRRRLDDSNDRTTSTMLCGRRVGSPVWCQQEKDNNYNNNVGHTCRIKNVIDWNQGDGSQLSHPTAVQSIWSGPGRRLATYSHLPLLPGWLGRALGSSDGDRTSSLHSSTPGTPPKGVYVVNPVTVVWDLVDQRGPGTTYTSTAYATGPGHALRGEERVTVLHRDGTGNGDMGSGGAGAVDVEIVSYSRPAPSLQGWLAWPILGAAQKSFFERQLETMQDVADRTPAAAAHQYHP